MYKTLTAWMAGNTVMATAVAISLALHGALFIVNFAAPELLQIKARDPGLEIVLVNTQSERAPTKPEVLAQVNLEGGGNKDHGRATSPLPNTGVTQDGDVLIQAQQRQEELEALQKALFAQWQQAKAQIEAQKLSADPTQKSGTNIAQSLRELRREATLLEARIEEENRRPKKHHFGTSARESTAALYVENFRQRVEQWGNKHYPTAHQGQLFGQVQITVVIDKHGQIHGLELNKSSGHKTLDEAALNIVRRAAPYGTFSEAMQKQMDLLSITRTMIFTQGTLETRSSP